MAVLNWLRPALSLFFLYEPSTKVLLPSLVKNAFEWQRGVIDWDDLEKTHLNLHVLGLESQHLAGSDHKPT